MASLPFARGKMAIHVVNDWNYNIGDQWYKLYIVQTFEAQLIIKYMWLVLTSAIKLYVSITPNVN